ncbi:MAG: hypothetical protein HY981_02085 [Candidatus Magasanikbacteria bacterium]|nr:hypothetical protein [Candidatus Magasanikbacteria bacterium]
MHGVRQTHEWGINILVTMMLFGVWLPIQVRAALEPEKNPTCWSKEACTEQYKSAKWCDDAATSCAGVVNWIAGGAGGECGTWGGCVPPGRTQLSIAFNGKTEVKDLGAYIKLLYAFLVGAAGVIAAVLIVKGGFEYITAGGASERISAAKKTIGSAVFGLLLVLASYVLLNTINPDLVRLRLPNVYMVRKIALGADWCKDSNPGKDSSGKEKQFANYKEGEEYSKATWNVGKESLSCGAQYLIPDGDGTTCVGDICKAGTGECVKDVPCACRNTPGKPKEAKCISGSLLGTINLYDKKQFVDDIIVYAFCTDGSIKKVDFDESLGEKSLIYKFPHQNSIPLHVKGADECGGESNLRGYFLEVEINDDTGIGGLDDDWIGGVSLCKPTSCPRYGDNSIDFSTKVSALNSDFSNSEFFTQEDMKKGITCNLNVTPSGFPPQTVFAGGKHKPCGD